MELTERIKEVCRYAYEHTDDMAIEKYSLNPESLSRYKRVYNQKPSAKVLVFDIEISPMKGYFWRTWKENIGKDQLTDPWFVLTWSAKWLYSPDMMNDRLTSEEALNQDDSRVVQSLWDLFDSADIIIAHNALKFDVPRMNTRFILNDLKPPSPYQVIDTLKVAQKEFAFPHNNLDALGNFFGIGRKIKTDFSLWDNCYHGDETALQEMLDYNDQDVILLEDVYVRLRPWIKSHPNMNLFTEDGVCPACGSRHIINTGTYRTNVNEYLAEQCECGAWSRRTKYSKMSTAR